jgi:acyl-CoA synthetase (AMP-forming)/AMP-acid ligase II
LLYGAAAALGAILLPVNWRLSMEEIIYNVNDCTPQLFFVDHEYQKQIQQAEKKMQSVTAVYNLKSDQGNRSSFNNLLDGAKQFKAADVTTDDGYVIIHTAAVGGKPRGALLSHGNLILASFHLNRLLGLTTHDVHLNLLPLFHIGGLMMAASAFHAGCSNINMSKFEAEQAAKLIENHNVSYLFDFAPILASILESAQKLNGNISTLRAVIGLDSPETIQTYQDLTGGVFYCMYGQTETSGLATLGRFNDRPGSAGLSLQLADVAVVDAKNGILPAGQTGEIVMKGPMIFKGYWNLDRDTKYTFRNNWHHTGDLGQFDEDGFLWFKGRMPEKELIKPGGENVYPSEVETALLQHPDVVQAVVFGVPDPKWKEGIKAVCRLKAGTTLDAQTLIQFVGQRIASYKKPQYVEFVDKIFHTEDGLVDRAKVKARYGGKQI